MAELNDVASRRAGRRDSIMVMGHIKAVGDVASTSLQIRIRNLSASGLMADSRAGYDLGSLVEIELRGVGTVAGEIVWIRDNRMGVAFTRTIDPDLVRKPVSAVSATGKVDRKLRRPGLRML